MGGGRHSVTERVGAGAGHQIFVAKGLTQADIAALMGCQQSRVSKLESGVDADLKFSDVEAYAKATNSNVTIMVSDRGKSLAEQIKAHAVYIRNAF